MQIANVIMLLNKVLIIGLGQLGLPAARYVKEIGFDIYGYDINTKAIEIAERTIGIKHAIDFGSDDFDVYVITVSTHKSIMESNNYVFVAKKQQIRITSFVSQVMRRI